MLEESLGFSIVGIQIRNFMGLERVDIDFEDEGDVRKTFPIFGGQGAGKSTIIRALQWCAYGFESSGRLSRSGILPKHWKGVVRDDQSVSIRFRPIDPASTSTDDIYCERVRKKESNSDTMRYRELPEGDENLPEREIKERFQQIFGKRPAIGVGTMWVIRSEEMKKVASSISGGEGSYFLEFMNMDSTKDALTKMISDLNKRASEKDKTKKGEKGLRAVFEESVRTMSGLSKTQGEHNKDRLKIKEWIIDNKLTSSEETQASSKEEFEKLLLKHKDNKYALREKQFDGSDISELVNALLSSKLKSEGVEIPKTFEANKYDWNDIADYCATTKMFTSETIQNLRDLESGAGHDTSGLIVARSKDWGDKNRVLKDKMKKFFETEIQIDEFEKDGINSDSVIVASGKGEELKKKKEELTSVRGKMSILRDKISSQQISHKEIRKKLDAATNAETELAKINKKIRIARSIHQAIEDTDSEYKDQTFTRMIDGIVKFWTQIDQDGKYQPRYTEETVWLERIADGELFQITTDKEGSASGGESQLLLVCICLSLAKTSGAKMPIILDDCFTDVDKATRIQLVKTVCKEFGSMIFVTNDEDKASIMDEFSDGTLGLKQWGKERVSVNDNEWPDWQEWS